MSLPPELSIIIPAFNEERRIRGTLQRIHAYLQERSLRAEVLVVDDGSTDATAKIVDSLCAQYPELRRSANSFNRGKGFSVRQGMLEARGKLALFSDADLSTPIEEADKLLTALREGQYDGAIGSRALNRGLIKAHQSVFREVGGIVFNRIVNWVTGLGFADTQCGFKAFDRARARIIFEQQRSERFGFDPELLFLARRHGLRVAEIPVSWAHDPDTKVRVFTDGLRMLRELAAIRRNAAKGLYPTSRAS